MPLHSKAPGETGVFNTLNDTVEAPGNHLETLTNAVDGLMVLNGTRSFSPRPDDAGKGAAWNNRHGLVGERLARFPVSIVSDDVGQVLMQGTSEIDVHELGASTNAKHGDIPTERGRKQTELPGVPSYFETLVAVGEVTAITRWVNIWTTRQNQAVEPGDDFVDVPGVMGLRWKEDPQTTGPADALEVLRWKTVELGVIDGHLAARAITRQANYWFHKGSFTRNLRVRTHGRAPALLDSWLADEPTEILDGFFQSFSQLHRGLPSELLLRERNIGLTLLRIILRERFVFN